MLGEIVAKYKLEQEKSKEKGKDIGLQADLREE